MNRFILLITLITLISCHKTEQPEPTTSQLNKLTKLHQTQNVFLLHTNLSKTEVEKLLNANITADFDDDDGDDDNEPEDDLNTTISTPLNQTQTTVIEVTEIITSNETSPIEEVVTVSTNTTPIQEQERKHQKKHDKQQIKEQKKERIHQQNQTVELNETVVNGSEVVESSEQNVTVMIQKEGESRMSLMGIGMCLFIVACFVGLIVFGTQYEKVVKKIAVRNEGLKDYLLFKENQQVKINEKSITDI